MPRRKLHAKPCACHCRLCLLTRCRVQVRRFPGSPVGLLLAKSQTGLLFTYPLAPVVGPLPAGLAITQRLLASPLFRSSRRVGVYVSCQRLREVDTSPVLEAILRPGAAAGRSHCASVAARSSFSLACWPCSVRAAVFRAAGGHRGQGDAAAAYWSVTCYAAHPEGGNTMMR